MRHNRAACLAIIMAAACDAAGGLAYAAAEHISSWLGLYYAVTTATTVGYGDVTPHTGAGHVIAAAIMLTVVPLFAATFSLLTTALTEARVKSHMRGQEERLKQHIENRLRHHLSEGAAE